MMSAEHKKPLMRCLGEFIGHIVRAVKSDVRTHEVNKIIEEKTDGKMTLRRTTIDEIEIHGEESTRE
jgi:hypothetical protein